MKNFILMLQFFTRIPININLEVKEEEFPKGIVYFPLVGLVIGLIDAISFVIFYKAINSITAIILMVLTNIMITGALHLDGLADTCDGIFSSRKKDKMLEIMKDSRLGTNGAVAIFFDLALKIALLVAIPVKFIIPIIIASNVLSRTMLVLICKVGTYARPEGGLGNLFIGKISKVTMVIAIVIGTILSLLLLGKATIIILPVIIGATLIINRYISSKIGGITGDVLGATNELMEILILLMFLMIGRF